MEEIYKYILQNKIILSTFGKKVPNFDQDLKKYRFWKTINNCQTFGEKIINFDIFEFGEVKEFANLAYMNKLQNDYLVAKIVSIQPRRSPPKSYYYIFSSPILVC